MAIGVWALAEPPVKPAKRSAEHIDEFYVIWVLSVVFGSLHFKAFSSILSLSWGTAPKAQGSTWESHSSQTAAIDFENPNLL